MAWLETNSYDSVVEKLENVKDGSSKFNEETRKEAEALLKDETINQKQRDTIQGYLDFYSTLKTSVDSEKEATKESVEQNGKTIIRKLEEINKDNDFSKFDQDLAVNIDKQLTFLEKEKSDDYLKILILIWELNGTYYEFIRNWFTENNNHFTKLIEKHSTKLSESIIKNSLDLKSKSLNENLSIYENEKHKLKKLIILDYLYKENIDTIWWKIQYDKNWTFNVVNDQGQVIETEAIKKIQSFITSSDLKTYLTYTKTPQYEMIHRMDVLWNDTIASFITKSPELNKNKIDKLSETSVGKFFLPLVLIGFVTGMIPGSKGLWDTWYKRLFTAWLWGLGLLTAKEMWYNPLDSAKNHIDQLTSGFFAGSNSNESAETLRSWKSVSVYSKNFEKLKLTNKSQWNPLSSPLLDSLFTQSYESNSFNSCSVATIEKYAYSVNNVTTKDVFWNKIPTYDDWSEIPDDKIKTFLSILLSQKENKDKNGDDLMKLNSTILGWSSEPHNATNEVKGTSETPHNVDSSILGSSDTQEKIQHDILWTSNNIHETDNNINGTTSTKAEYNHSILGTNWIAPNIDNDVLWASQYSPEELNFKRYETIGYLIPWQEKFLAEDWLNTADIYTQLSEKSNEFLELHGELNMQVDNLLFLLQTIEEEYTVPLLEKLNTRILGLSLDQQDESVALLENTLNEILKELPKEIKELSDEISILEYLRENWYTNAVSSYIVDKEFSTLKISDEELDQFITTGTENPTIKKLKLEDADLYEKINERSTEISVYLDKFRNTILPEYMEYYPEESEHDIIKMIKEGMLKWYARELLYSTALSQTAWLTWVNSDKNMEILFGDMKGIGLFDLSDENMDILTEEAAIFVATQVVAIWAGLVTMWAWTAVVNSIVYWTRWVRWLKAMSTIWKTANLSLKWAGMMQSTSILWAKTARLATLWATNWVSFYGWYAWVNGIDTEKLWNDNEFEYNSAYSLDGAKDAALFGIAWRLMWTGSKLGWELMNMKGVGSTVNIMSKLWNVPVAWKIGKFTLSSAISLSPAYLWLALSEWEDFNFELSPGEWSKEEIMTVLLFIASAKLPTKNLYSSAANHSTRYKFSNLGWKINVKMPSFWAQNKYQNMSNVKPHSTTEILKRKASKITWKFGA